ncbi:Nuclear autoantigen Sp-100 [Lemmus lemmus]
MDQSSPAEASGTSCEMEVSSSINRMPTEEEDTGMTFLEAIFLHYRSLKVIISNAIKTPFPFLEVLRDKGLITDKMYNDFKDSCTNLVPVQNVVYRALEELEKNFDLQVLRVLFGPGNRSEYPNLEPIFKHFKKALPQNELWSEEIDRRDPNSQLSIEQGPVDSCSQESLTWSPSGPSSSDAWRSHDGENTTLTQGNQTENHKFLIPQIHNAVILSENGLSEDVKETVQINHMRGDTTGDDIDELQRPQAAIPSGPGSEPEAPESCEVKAQLSDGDARLEPHIPLPCSSKRAAIPSPGIEIRPCFVNLVNIKQENSSVFLDCEQQTHSRTGHNKASDIVDLISDDSDDENSCSVESTSVICQSKPVNSRNHPTPRNIHGRGDTSDTDSSSIRKRQRRTICPREPILNNVNFSRPELPVTCGNAMGTLYKEKFEQGTHETSIQTETGEWLTLREFEIRGGHEKSKNWKQSIRCYGWTLKELIEEGFLPNPVRTKEKARRPGMCGNDNRVHGRQTRDYYAGSTSSVLHTTPPGAHAVKQSQEQAELEGIPLGTTFCGEHASHLSEPQHSHKNSEPNNLGITVGIRSAKTLKRNLSTDDTNQQPKQYGSSSGRAACVGGEGYAVRTELASAEADELLYWKLFHALGLAISKLKCCSSKFKMPFIKGKCHALSEHFLPGPLAEGNNTLTDKFTKLIALSQVELAQ